MKLSHADLNRFRQKRLWVILFFLLVFLCYSRESFPIEQERLHLVKNWTTEHGLPQNSVQCLTQDNLGYLWLGTPSGLVRFDGVSFRVYNRWNASALANDHITTLFKDSHGVLWIGTDDGGLIYQKESLSGEPTFSYQPDIAGNAIRAITEDSHGGLWVGTDYGLNLITEKKITHFTMEDGLSALAVTALEAGDNGEMWIGTRSGGLNCMKEGKFRFIPFFKEFSVHPGAITALYNNNRGILWVGTENGLFRLETMGEQSLRLSYLAHSSIRCLSEIGGDLWIGTEGDGLFRLKNNRIEPVPTRHQLPDYFVNAILEDQEGNSWVGTYTSGLVRLRKAVVDVLTQEDGIPGNIIQAIRSDRHGNMWIATDREGINLFDLQKKQITRQITSKNGLISDRCLSIWIDDDISFWVGTRSGLNHFNGKNVHTYDTGNGLSSNEITVIYRDRSNQLWVGTDKGLNRYSGNENRFVTIRGNPSLANSHIRRITETKKGNLLVGTRSGLYFSQPRSSEFKLLGTGDESQNPTLRYDYTSLFIDNDGILWAGTNGDGLIRWDFSNLSQPLIVTANSGLPDNHIFSINKDARGHLWLSSYRGVFRIDISQLNRFIEGSVDGSVKTPLPVSPVLFDEQEGMAANQCIYAGDPSSWLAADGKLYVPTIKGVAVFDTEASSIISSLPAIYIDQIKVDNRSIIPVNGESISVVSSNRMVEIYFTSPIFTAPGKVQFLVRLEGIDKEWRRVSFRQKRRILYSSIEPGTYRFCVMAAGNNGQWNEKETCLTLQVLAPIYKRGYFYFILLFLFSTAIIAFVYYRKKHSTRDSSQPHPEGEAIDPKESKFSEVKEKYKTSALLQETVDSVMPKLNRLMEEEKLFLKPEMNLKSLSKHLNVHYNHLSQIINEQYEKSFNDFINSYRIAEAQKRLIDPKCANKTILEIAYDTGFYSKSVFNTAFKKFTGMTPSQFRKKNFFS